MSRTSRDRIFVGLLACVTDVGVVLRSKWQDGKGVLEATQVTYAPQPAALFTPPAGFQKLELPAGMPPMGQPGNRPPGR